MRNMVVIEISGKMLQMTRMVPVVTGSLLARLSKALMGTQAYKKADVVQLIGAIDASSVGARLGQALDALGKRNGQSLKSCDVRVQLGSDFAKVAIIENPGSEGKDLSVAALHSHLQTWMTWNWGATSLGIMRHASLENGRLMVSVVAKDMAAALEQFCSDKMLRLVDCRPAVLSVLESLTTQTATTGFNVVAVEEVCEGHPSPLVQFITRNHVAALSIHRMWLPQASQESIQGVAQRLKVHHAYSTSQTEVQLGDVTGAVPTRRVQWPTTAGVSHHG